MQPASHPPYPRLLADIGGTHARFGWQAAPGDGITAVQVLRSADYPTLLAAVRAYLAVQGLAPPRAAALAVASLIQGDMVRMTNHHWRFSQRELQAALGLEVLRVVNDFTALALALPAIPRGELRQVGGGRADPAAAIALLGAGTGLGASGLLPDGRGGWVPIQGEGGHVTLPASSPRERLVMAGLAARYGRVSAERFLCGQGLLEGCLILCAADGVDASALRSPADVTAAALAGSLPQAGEALAMFCGLLGSVAGNLVLTLGARGGLYLGGGIVPRLGDWFDRSPFRERFERKGRYQAHLATIPAWVITSAQSPALLGVARALE